ncbi:MULTISPECIES: abortive infection family protein [Burkholderiales]|uniref:Abortive infection protein n=2 Tax=Pseudomonadota TaxID=1224 RepID=A0A0S1B0M0_9GAMM|nr:abortive infection family protein [Cupriavidus gilardii]ALJ28532.1 abortive infection protein [Stenotrophomonas acidaminiphila]
MEGDLKMANELSIQAEALQNLLISQATGGSEDDAEFVRLRQALLSNTALDSLVPQFLRTCRSLAQFWQFIKYKYKTYAERRNCLWSEFRPILDALERGGLAPSDSSVTTALEKFDAAHVQAAWSKALDRRSSDPEGAITSARTLIESVCKHILDEAKVSYDDTADLPKLYKQTAEILKLAPSQHTEQIFKQILGGCTSVVEGLGSLRNRLSDAHGKGRIGIKPAPRHAELAVNLSGTLANYLLATWEARNEAAT